MSIWNKILGRKEAEIEYTTSYNGGFYVTTDLELKGRGIKKTGNGEHHARNKKTYQVTEISMNKLKQNYQCEYYSDAD